jgi:heme A synthase
MQISGLHRYSLLVAGFTLLLIVTGTLVTSTLPATPGPVTPEQQIHRWFTAVVGLLTIGLAFRLARAAERPELAKLGWAALALVVVQAAVGMLAPEADMIHAILALLFFGLTVAIAAVTSAEWSAPAEQIEDQMRPPLPVLAHITLAMVLVQITLGAAVRHKVMGSISHIGFAMLVALIALLLGMCVLHQAPEHRRLRPSAVLLMVIVGVQVFLGFGSFILKLMMAETDLAVAIVTAAHVTTAALVLGSTVLLDLEIHRYLKADLPHRAGARPTVAS